MNAQASLFDVVPVGAHRRTDPRTSTESARSVNATRQRDQILRELYGCRDGLTPDELAGRMRPVVHRSTVASRLAQMRSDGLVEPFGVRLNERQRRAQVWFAVTPRRSVDVPVGDRL